MNVQRFDDLARRLSGARTDRRTFVSALGFGAATALTSSIGPTIAQDATPAPAVVVEPVDPPMNVVNVTQKAFELGLDVGAIFNYVAEEVRYEAYSGALRGETGTLWSMAGNSVDQALLLAALLKEALLEVRFAIGTLDDVTAQELAVGMILDSEAFRAADRRAQVANLSVNGASALDMQSNDGTTPALTTEQQQAVDQAVKTRDELIAEAGRQLSESVNLIADALVSKNISLPDPAAPSLPDRERQQHVWVQYANGTEWVDLDPSMPNAEAGKAYATPAETVVELPAELDHLVRFHLDKETIYNGAPYRETIITVERKARDLVGVPVAFSHVDPAVMKALGSEILGLIDGTKNYMPIFFVGKEAESADNWVQFGGGGGILSEDALGGETSNEGDTLAEWLITEIVTPDRTFEPIERVIFDRIGIEKRAAAIADGTEIDVTAVPPVDLVDLGDGGSDFAPMQSVCALAVVGGRVPAWFFDPSRFSSNDLIANFSLGEHGYHLLRDQLGLELGLVQGYHFYADAPNVTAYRLEPHAGPSGQPPELSVEIDLIHRSVAPVPVNDAQPADHAGILSGVLAHVAERMSLETTDWTGDNSRAAIPAAISVGRVFEEAVQQNIPVAVLTSESTASGLGALDVSAQAAARIGEALAAGNIVVVPEKGVPIDGAPVSGWWQIDPLTGTTLDRMENGRGNVAARSARLLSPMGEDTVIIVYEVVGPWRYLLILSCAIWSVTLFAAAIGLGLAIAYGDAKVATGALLGAGGALPAQVVACA